MKTQKSDVDTRTVSTRITRPMLKAIQTLLATNAHINIADYVRDLIRRDLEERGVLTKKETSE